MVYFVCHFQEHGYFPAPFHHDPHDTFMDFFNINWWSIRDGFYTEFHSYYAPLNAFLGAMLTPEHCAQSADPYTLRTCALSHALWFHAVVWLLNTVLLYLLLGGTPGRTAWCLLLACSFPMLFALERGNYIVLAMNAISLYVLAGRRTARAVPVALAITFKSYLGVLAVTSIVRDRNSIFLLALLTTLVLAVIFGTLIPDSQWLSIPANLLKFSQGASGWIGAVANATTFNRFALLAETLDAPPGLVFVTQYLILIMKFAVTLRLWVLFMASREQLQDEHYLGLCLLVGLLLLSDSPGFYAIILLYPLIANALSRGRLDKREKLLCILLVLPYPIRLFSWFSASQPSSFNPLLDIQFESYYTVQGMVTPFVLLFLFMSLTSSSKWCSHESVP